MNINPVPSFFHQCSQWGVQRLRLGSIKGKILVVFGMTFVLIGALTALNYWNLSTLKKRMELSERYDDLLNNILEVRRFEKNYLIYSDKQNLSESKEYLNHIDTLVADLADDLPLLDGERAYVNFKNSLLEYRHFVDRISAGDSIGTGKIRTLGKSLTDAADHFRVVKRKRIHATFLRSLTIPFFVLAILLGLMVLVFQLISQGLLKPLDVVMGTTQSVGRGDFSPIFYDGIRLEEISGLIEAFNRMALELETNQEDLIQTRKIAAIGTFTAGIAHELNNPINNISLTAESLNEEYGGNIDENCSEMLRDIQSQAERAADIVKNLLDFSRTENPAFTQLTPALIVSSTVNLVKNQVKIVGMQLDLFVADNLPEIKGNLGNLQQVFANLLLNAVQATSPGGKIAMQVELADIQGFVKFAVVDNGAGIPKDIQEKIFEPFFSTKEVGNGTGLGLAVSFAIVKRHGGRIEVCSEPGQGTRISVLLPYIANDFSGWSAG